MTTERFVGILTVLLVGVAVCLGPAMSRPTVRFGVRVPMPHVGDEVIVRQTRRYYRRAAAVLPGCLLAASVLPAADLVPVLVPVQLLAGLGLFLIARRRVAAVKAAENWFDGLSQRIATDTRWRTEAEPFPLRWLIPAAVVVLVTLGTGIARYPRLAARIPVHFTASGAADRWASTSVRTAFAPVGAQVMVTALIVVLLWVTCRGRPDVEVTDVPGSTRRYRVFLRTMTRSVLVFVALADLGIALECLQSWQIWRPAGLAAALPVVPALAGSAALVVVGLRLGQSGSRLPRVAGSAERAEPDRRAAVTDRDDDRFWKTGLLYVNRDDPALLVGKRLGVGFTLNVGNPWTAVLAASLVVLIVGVRWLTH